MTRLGQLAVLAVALMIGGAAVAAPRGSAPFDVAATPERAARQQPQPLRSLRAPGAAHGFTLWRRPAGRGEVRMNLGARFEVLGAASGALRLRDRATGEESAYAGAALTDAAGATTRIDVVREGEELIAVVPTAVLASAAYPLVIDPGVGPAFGAAPGSVQAIGFDGTNYLIAWSADGAIRAARVSPQGTVLDPGGVLVAQGSASANQLSVAYAGGVFLVAWTQLQDLVVDYTPYGGGTFLVKRAHLFTARVDRQGNVLDPGGALVARESAELCSSLYYCEDAYPTVAVGADGSGFLVAWAKQDDLLTAHVTPAGVVASPTEVPQVFPAGATWYGAVRNPSIAFDGASYLVVAWDRVLGNAGADLNTVGVRLTSDGTPLAPGWSPLLDAGESWYSFPYYTRSTDVNPRTAIAFDGDTLLVSWTRVRQWSGFGPDGWGPRDVLLSRVGADGALLDPGGILLGEVMAGPNPPIVASAFDGCNVVAAWGDRAVRVGADGAVLDPSPWTLVGPLTAMASDGAGTVLVMSGTQGQLVRTCDRTPPVITVPSAVSQAATSTQGAVVPFTASALDAQSGAVPVTCTPGPGSRFPLGVTTVTCQAADPSGNVGVASFTVRVTYAWSGFLSPLDPAGTPTLTRARTIQVRFQLTGASAGITDLAASFVLRRVTDAGATTAAAVAALWGTSSGSRFSYDAARRQYVFNLVPFWLAPGKYEVQALAGDGVARTARFTLR